MRFAGLLDRQPRSDDRPHATVGDQVLHPRPVLVLFGLLRLLLNLGLVRGDRRARRGLVLCRATGDHDHAQ